MKLGQRSSCVAIALSLGCISAKGCREVPWPESPLYDPPVSDCEWEQPTTLEEARRALEGHYAHYDIVAYESEISGGPLRTLILSYGFTDLVLRDGELIEFDRFCHAEHKANQNMVSYFDDAATQAIQPRTAVVDVFKEGGVWKLRRPATPTLLGIDGDPDQPLSMDPNDPNINDADGDGKPGVTVQLKIAGFLKAEIYIARREVFESDVTLYSDGTLFGHVVDSSEQLVIGATHDFLAVENNPEQHPDYGLSPLMLVPVPQEFNSCEALMANRDALFPPEPEFDK